MGDLAAAKQAYGRAILLRPSVLAQPLPAYENQLDHAGLIAGLDAKSYRRGEQLFGRLCANCHGTHDSVGSMPTSLRFANLAAALSEPQTQLRLFGKPEVNGKRRMGVALAQDATVEAAVAKALRVAAAVRPLLD